MGNRLRIGRILQMILTERVSTAKTP